MPKAYRIGLALVVGGFIVAGCEGSADPDLFNGGAKLTDAGCDISPCLEGGPSRGATSASGTGGHTGAGGGGAPGGGGGSGAGLDGSQVAESNRPGPSDSSVGEHEVGPALRRPVGVTLGVSAPTTFLSPSPGGAMYTDTCPQDGVAIGFIGTMDPPSAGITFPRTLALVCGSLSISGEGAGPFQVKTAFLADLPPRGDFAAPLVQSRVCPPDQVVVGFEPRLGQYVDQLSFACAPLTITAGSDAYILSIGPSKTLAPIGGFGGQVFPPITCAMGAIATTSILRAGLAIDAFGLACARPSLVFAPP